MNGLNKWHYIQFTQYTLYFGNSGNILKLVAYYLIKHKINTVLIIKLFEFLFGNACFTLSPFHKKELSDCPVDAIRMAVNFLYSYVIINLKIDKCTVK
jgi:hypothetical protein